MGIFESLFKKKVKGSWDKQNEQRVAASKSAGQPYKIGDRIANRYEIHRILGGEGKSGMGIVYVCYDHEFKQTVVLKTFQDKYLLSKTAKDAFKKEALAWTRLERHPYIVQAQWVQEFDYRIFVAAELIAPDDGGRNTLTHYLKSPILPKQALTWSIQFCHGMEHAYSKGVTPHRDIKPDNIMITPDGTLKITDFGLAGVWEGAEAGEGLKEEKGKGLSFLEAGRGRVICGTPPWMAPEQFDGIADVRSDIYAFGVVMYQMASGGNLPFYPKERDDWKTAHTTYPVPSLQANSSLSLRAEGEAISKLSQIIERCLKKNQEERHKDFTELRGELDSVTSIL